MPITQELPPRGPEAFYPDEMGLKEITAGLGTRMIIPQRYLFPRQGHDEYGQSKRKKVELEFRRNPHYMDENPVIVSVLQYKNSTVIAIIDGHHRVRYAPKYGVKDIPCVVLDIEELVYTLNKSETERNNVTADSAKEKIEQEILLAQESFVRKGIPDSKLPLAVPFNATIPELATFFASRVDNK